ncbi:hypothetical protein QQ045_024790 [Rhodiola kirilowii]
MDNDSWQYLMSSSSRLVAQSRSDVGYDYEAYCDEDGEEIYTEFPCPYCNDDFDLVELCFHIEDVHFSQAKNGVCPVCAVEIYIQQKLKLLKGKPDANLSILLKEFHEEYLKSLLDGSSVVAPSSAMDPDPLLSSFFYNVPPVAQSESVQLIASSEPILSEKSSGFTISETKARLLPLSDKEHEERIQRSEFVQGLVWSSFFGDNL